MRAHFAEILLNFRIFGQLGFHGKHQHFGLVNGVADDCDIVFFIEQRAPGAISQLEQMRFAQAAKPLGKHQDIALRNRTFELTPAMFSHHIAEMMRQVGLQVIENILFGFGLARGFAFRRVIFKRLDLRTDALEQCFRLPVVFTQILSDAVHCFLNFSRMCTRKSGRMF